MFISSYLYEYDFYSVAPFGNLVSDYYNGYDGLADPITARLMNNIRYVLVVTTFYANQIGSFSIKILGREEVHLWRIGEYTP